MIPRALLVVLLGMSICSFGLAGEDGEPLLTKSYPAPWLPKTESGEIVEAKEIPGSDGLDVRKPLEAMGMTFPPGAEAIYYPDLVGLVMRNTQANHNLVASDGCGWSFDYRVTIVVASFDIPKSEALRNLTYAGLRRVAGESWKEVVSIEGVAASGVPMVLEKLVSQKSTPSVAGLDIPADAVGAKFKIEPVIGPDGTTFDLDLESKCRLPNDNGFVDFSYHGKSTAKSGIPHLIQIVRDGKGETGFAIILKMDCYIRGFTSTEQGSTSAPAPQPR